VPRGRPSNDGRENQGLLAEAYLHSGQYERAREIFGELISTTPNAAQPDDISLGAAKGLDLLDGGSGAFDSKAPDLAEPDHLLRANIYQFNRDFARAKLHLDAVVARFSSGANTPEAIFQIGRGFAQRSEPAEALKWFERVLEQYPQNEIAPDALLHAASAYSRLGKANEAIRRYQNFIEKYPTDARLDRAYLNIVDVYRDQGAETEARLWAAKTQEAFRGKLPEAVAIFAEARISVAREDWPAALSTLDRLKAFPDLGGASVPGGTSAGEVSFLRGVALEQMKRYPEAVDTYLSIADGRDEYYGWRSTERLKALARDETGRSFIAQKIGALAAELKAKDADMRRQTAQSILRLTDSSDLRERALVVLRGAVKSLPRYQPPTLKLREEARAGSPLANRLVALGLYDEAAPEIEADTSRPLSATTDPAYTFATWYARGNRGDRGIAFIEPIWRRLPADHPIELIPREHLDLLYPAPYADELLRSATQRGVDPRLVLAIMRQESRFQPDAKSYAAARGLMQFISDTATRVAGKLGRDSFRQDDLYYPPTAVLFGSQYLADLFKEFPNLSDAVVASYNGGDDNMKRWLARSRSNLPERYVPEIAYSQTKDYVYKVMANYRMYQYMYDDQLRPR
jgi:soluble lytic murein transglycosylase